MRKLQAKSGRPILFYYLPLRNNVKFTKRNNCHIMTRSPCPGIVESGKCIYHVEPQLFSSLQEIFLWFMLQVMILNF